MSKNNQQDQKTQVQKSKYNIVKKRKIQLNDILDKEEILIDKKIKTHNLINDYEVQIIQKHTQEEILINKKIENQNTITDHESKIIQKHLIPKQISTNEFQLEFNQNVQPKSSNQSIWKSHSLQCQKANEQTKNKQTNVEILSPQINKTKQTTENFQKDNNNLIQSSANQNTQQLSPNFNKATHIKPQTEQNKHQEDKALPQENQLKANNQLDEESDYEANEDLSGFITRTYGDASSDQEMNNEIEECIKLANSQIQKKSKFSEKKAQSLKDQYPKLFCIIHKKLYESEEKYVLHTKHHHPNIALEENLTLFKCQSCLKTYTAYGWWEKHVINCQGLTQKLLKLSNKDKKLFLLGLSIKNTI
ncbi:hypothetical protein ABPG72_005706 [Tetrahymena utriculariae]